MQNDLKLEGTTEQKPCDMSGESDRKIDNAAGPLRSSPLLEQLVFLLIVTSVLRCAIFICGLV